MSRPQLVLRSVSDILYSEPRTATVWISHSNTYQRVNDPIYHRIGDLRHRDPEPAGNGKTRHGWDVKTTCDATVSTASWLDGPNRWETSDYRNNDHGLRLPIRWAVQFARPCRRCWP